jgi:indole-3-glycerol phosphate synthase
MRSTPTAHARFTLLPVAGPRHLSQRISEGDGIAVIVCVRDLDGAVAAEEQGAKALAVDRAIFGIREATSLPLLWIGDASPIDADARRIRPEDETDHGELEPVVDVRDEEELELALERIDPEIFLLSAREIDEDEDPLDAVLELLPDVPAGKLAIAEVDVSTRDEVLALERAGIDAVLVPAGHVGELVGARPPEV